MKYLLSSKEKQIDEAEENIEVLYDCIRHLQLAINDMEHEDLADIVGIVLEAIKQSERQKQQYIEFLRENYVA